MPRTPWPGPTTRTTGWPPRSGPAMSVAPCRWRRALRYGCTWINTHFHAGLGDAARRPEAFRIRQGSVHLRRSRTTASSATSWSSIERGTMRGRWRASLGELQDRLCAAFAAADGTRGFERDSWQRSAEGGALAGRGHHGGPGRLARCSSAALFAPLGCGAVKNYRPRPRRAIRSSPAEATARLGVSVVMHPRSPQIPTSHMNVRFFQRRGCLVVRRRLRSHALPSL